MAKKQAKPKAEPIEISPVAVPVEPKFFLNDAMKMLAERADAIFLGQSVDCPGTSMYASFDGVDAAKRLEMPVAEQLQLGISIGLSMEGYLPVSVFPRWNFLLSATDMLVNHLDRIPIYSNYRPKVIVRTAEGSASPLDPGHQHKDDFTRPFDMMLKTVRVVRLSDPDKIVPEYRKALEAESSTILVETPGM